jgi:NSS family neurotransmitter:Na+ symporter
MALTGDSASGAAMNARGQWGSRVGFILAAAGSSVGLGNLWKFPYLTWENGGGGFVLVYLLSVIFLGFPIMVAEILIGRRAQASPVPAFEKLGGRGWSVVGWLGVAAGAIILSYYTVIAGWSLRSFFQCVMWSVNGYEAPAGSEFGRFLASGWLQIGLTALFTVFTTAIVYRGIGGGIERASKIMMPALLLILVYLLITALTLKKSGAALDHMWIPRFDRTPAHAVLLAMGQAFFSLSLGLGAMITYGSYLRKQESIPRAAAWVVVCDSGVALIAGMTMFSIIHSVPGLDQRVSASSVGMIFITLPELFYTTMPGGVVLGPLFFVLVAFAALTSTISLGEVAASLLIDRLGWSRPRAVIVSAATIFVASVLCALSVGAVGPLSTFEVFKGKAGLLSTLDHLVANDLLPLGGLGITVFVGWFLGRKACLEELGLERPPRWFTVWIWCVRVLAPLLILALLALVLSGKRDFS